MNDLKKPKELKALAQKDKRLKEYFRSPLLIRISSYDVSYSAKGSSSNHFFCLPYKKEDLGPTNQQLDQR